MFNFYKTKTLYRLFAVAPPGLESLVAWELVQLGITPRLQAGGVSFRGGLPELYRSNLWLRVSSRVLLRVAEFKSFHLGGLAQKVARYPWELYIPPEFGLKIRATCVRSRIYHSGAVAERVKRGIEARLRRKLATFSPSMLIVVRIFRDHCTISVDSSGADLFKRGYKVGKGPAPLRENLAAALLLGSGWDRLKPVFDPFCGTGTVAIEAAMILAHQAPGLKRGFAFEYWRNFDPHLWERLKDEARQRRIAPSEPIVWASDKAPGAIEATRLNVKAAGVEDWIVISQRDIKDLRPPGVKKGWLITNPPYGQRLRPSKDIRALYGVLGGVFRRYFDHWQMALLSPFPETPAFLGLAFKKVTSFTHGGIKVRLFSTNPGEMLSLF